MSITSDAGDSEMLDGVQQLAAEREDARCWAVRLEGMLARGIEAQRSVALLCERAEADRDTALGRLASCSHDAAAYRQQRDEVVTALAALVAALDDEVTCDPADERAARTLVARYRPTPATATIESERGRV